jgi:hypothetical protein
MISLRLFNAVLRKESSEDCYVSVHGYVIESGALWAKDRITSYYAHEKLNGNDLNKTFHKSWAKIQQSDRFDLLIEQIRHYLSTYGSGFQDEVYIPDEVLDLPAVKLKYKVIHAFSRQEMTEKCLELLASGIALKEETISDLLSLLVDECGYAFTGEERIRNKEAVVKIADMYGVLPAETESFFRYILYRATGQSLLIKSPEVIGAIKATNFNPCAHFDKHGLEKLAAIFNRYKPLFLAFKSKCPRTINRISKLSKRHHKPMVKNPLNHVTHEPLPETRERWLDNATPFALFRAMAACYSRAVGQDAFVYRIRNGKSWAAKGALNTVVHLNLDLLVEYAKKRFDLSGQTIYLPEDVKYGLPTSEKMFVGHFPTGTRFYGKKLAVGIYWENKWGAQIDLDLSGVNIGGKVGWNSDYNQGGGSLMYSGDITHAEHGAVEYLYANKGLDEPTLVKNNVYFGEPDCEYKIIVGRGDKVSRDYMMNPNNLFVEIKCKSVQKQTILGLLLPKKRGQCFVLLNFGAGHARVSGDSEVSRIATAALLQQWSKPLSFNKLVKWLGAEVVDDKGRCQHDYSLESIQRDSFMRLFK